MSNITKIAPYKATSSVFGDYLAAKILKYDSHDATEARLITGAALVRYKRMIRSNLKKYDFYRDKHDCGELLNAYRNGLVTFGKGLMHLFPVYDEVASLHDKAQILNVHHCHVERKAKEIGSDNLLDLVVAHAEYTGNDPFVSGGESMPFFEAYMAVFHDMLLNDTEFKQRTRNAFREHFPDIPMYRLTQNPDGSEDMVRVPPPLKVMGADGEVERFVER